MLLLEVLMKNIFVACVVMCVSGCALFQEGFQEGPAPDVIVEGYVPPKVFTSDAAVNRMITSLSVKCVTRFGSKSPVVERQFMAGEKIYNNLAERVFHALVKGRSIKPYYKGVTADADYILVSNIIEVGGDWIWQLKFVHKTNNKQVWKQQLKLDL